MVYFETTWSRKVLADPSADVPVCYFLACRAFRIGVSARVLICSQRSRLWSPHITCLSLPLTFVGGRDSGGISFLALWP